MKKLILAAVAVTAMAVQFAAQATVIIPPTLVTFSPLSPPGSTATLNITYSVTETAGVYTYTYALSSAEPLTSFTIGGAASPLLTDTMAITLTGGALASGITPGLSVGWVWFPGVTSATVAYTSDYGPSVATFTLNDNGITWGSPPGIPAPVPEASTALAGLLMVVPLGIGAIRALRKERVA